MDMFAINDLKWIQTRLEANQRLIKKCADELSEGEDMYFKGATYAYRVAHEMNEKYITEMKSIIQGIIKESELESQFSSYMQEDIKFYEEGEEHAS